MKQKRHALRKREEALRKRDSIDWTIHSAAPHYDFITNDTCILAPEVTQGPYWYPPREVLRRDITEGEAGVPFELEIGIVDVNTCEPVPDALIAIWHCNATGSYSAFDYSPNTPFETLLKGLGITNLTGIDNWAFLSNGNSTFLRGMWPTDSAGVTSFKSIVPGFYVDRSIHIHAQVYTDWDVTINGTVDAGTVIETGQIFLPEDLSEEIMALQPYASHTEIERLKNSNDSLYAQVLASGADSTIDYEPLDGVDVKNGVLGYVTFGVELGVEKNGTTASPSKLPLIMNPTEGTACANDLIQLASKSIECGSESPQVWLLTASTNCSFTRRSCKYAYWSALVPRFLAPRLSQKTTI